MFCSLLVCDLTVGVVVRARPAASSVVDLHEDGLLVPAPRSPQPPVISAFQKWSVFTTEISYNDIGTRTKRKSPQNFQAEFKRKKKRMNLAEVKTGQIYSLEASLADECRKGLHLQSCSKKFCQLKKRCNECIGYISERSLPCFFTPLH